MTSSVSYAARALPEEERRMRGPDAPMFIDPQITDPLYEHPVIDEEKEVTEPTLLHVVSGHFVGTTIKFKIYLPPKALWSKRFFQYVYPLQPADALPADIAFGAASGGYTVQCTGTLGYRHEAATAQFSRSYASKYYAVDAEEINGYIYGGSGGSYIVIAALENTYGIWQGGVPFVQGTTQSMPNSQSIVSFGTLVLTDKLDKIRDSVSPGGDGDPHGALSSEESAVLTEVSRHGVPTRGWETLNGDSENVGRLLMFYPFIRDMDPTYADDFWAKEGYLGTEQSGLGDLFRRRRLVDTVKIDSTEVDGDGNTISMKVHLKLSEEELRGLDFTIVNNNNDIIAKPKGSYDLVTKVFTLDESLPSNIISPESRFLYDNSWFLASHVYHRYHLPSYSGYNSWDQYRQTDGKPIYPQRNIDIGSAISKRTSGGGLHTGFFKGKMIVVQNLLDIDACPCNADWYRTRVNEAHGSGSDDCYRLWYNDHAHHYNGSIKSGESGMFFQYDGIYYQALRDVANWVEKDQAPPRSTSYRIEDGQVVVPRDSEDRGGIQPVVQSLVNGCKRAEVQSGQPVTFQALVTVPTGAGLIIRAEWDFIGKGDYSHLIDVPTPCARLSATTSHTYNIAGTFFPVIRVTTQRDGDVSERFALVYNLSRNRVVVYDAA